MIIYFLLGVSTSNFISFLVSNSLKPIEFNTTKIGTQPTGISLPGTLVILNHDACSEMPKFQLNDRPFKNFVLVNSEGCSPYVKARNIQSARGYIAIIVSDTHIKKGELKVEIPVLQIRAKEGEQIMNYHNTHSTENIHVKVIFMENRKSKVNLQIWLSSANKQSYFFLLQIADFCKKLKKQIQFAPHYALSSRFSGQGKNVLGCLSSGRYCAIDHQHVYSLDYSGKAVVWENLRQLVIYEQFPDLWFDYIFFFAENCLPKMGLFSDQSQLDLCANLCMTEAKIDSFKISVQMSQSFIGPQPTLDDNIILLAQRDLYLEQGVNQFPEVILNKNPVRFTDLSSSGIIVQRQICTYFAPHYNDPCKQIDSRFRTADNFLLLALIVIGAMLVILTLCCMFCYKRMMRKRMLQELSSEVQQSMMEYKKFTELTQLEKEQI